MPGRGRTPPQRLPGCLRLTAAPAPSSTPVLAGPAAYITWGHVDSASSRRWPGLRTLPRMLAQEEVPGARPRRTASYVPGSQCPGHAGAAPRPRDRFGPNAGGVAPRPAAALVQLPERTGPRHTQGSLVARGPSRLSRSWLAGGYPHARRCGGGWCSRGARPGSVRLRSTDRRCRKGPCSSWREGVRRQPALPGGVLLPPPWRGARVSAAGPPGGPSLRSRRRGVRTRRAPPAWGFPDRREVLTRAPVVTPRCGGACRQVPPWRRRSPRPLHRGRFPVGRTPRSQPRPWRSRLGLVGGLPGSPAGVRCGTRVSTSPVRRGGPLAAAPGVPALPAGACISVHTDSTPRVAVLSTSEPRFLRPLTCGFAETWKIL